MVEVTARTFEDILVDYENMIYYLIRKYQVRDPDGEFYQEGVIALWRAMESYDEQKGKFSSYAYFLIEKAILSLIRKRNRTSQNEEQIIMLTSADIENTISNLELDFDAYLLEQIKQTLSENQLKWFQLFVLEDLSIKDIASREKVSVDAVKNWARLAKPKIRMILSEK